MIGGEVCFIGPKYCIYLQVGGWVRYITNKRGPFPEFETQYQIKTPLEETNNSSLGAYQKS